jgi:hypothetical protein
MNTKLSAWIGFIRKSTRIKKGTLLEIKTIIGESNGPKQWGFQTQPDTCDILQPV